ncbi:long-chain-fatty-acid--CoA ligase [Microtetraspora sp. NBRC 13810]|uniref:long-chain-fatty-acid--CoA ligase n=1 Tax=Microtetraspora sp. NBRC 13810 TaxID=3030990 RepID=UPI0024A21280|nr:long-chain fatty acid--CoA ligase [Microtetraspora sp. NBRC 13810]GLW11937.1 long-chain-fatty-acid--CoA ligase [Microtetraspora sp. NBRC 13810]
MLSVAMLLGATAREHPGRAAVIDDLGGPAGGARRVTYAELDERSARVAALLVSAGIAPGDRVAMTCPNSAWFPVVYYGILKAGAVVVPINVLLRAPEVAATLVDSGARAYFCDDGDGTRPSEGRIGYGAAPGCTRFFGIGPELDGLLAGLPPLRDYHPTEPADPAVILYSSGTTGTPKGARLTHANLVLNTVAVARLYGTAEHDVHLVAAPLSHILGQSVQMNFAFATGATLVPMPRFDPARAASLMAEHRVTFFAGVPTMYWTLAETCEEPALAAACAHLRVALSGGAPLSAALMDRYRERYGVQLLEGYGLSEAGTAVSVSPQDGPRAPAGTIGKPVWGVDLRLVGEDGEEAADGEVGEIVLRGPCVMAGYQDRPEETAAVLRDGWFRTGDLARRDADGFYFIVDRVKNMILRGGYTVYPREIEDRLAAHPAVGLAVVVGVPDEKYGEEIKAVVVRRQGAEVTAEELLAWGREGLAAHKYPRIIEFRDAVPLNSTGKVIRNSLRYRL